MKKLLFITLFLLTNVLYAEGFYSVKDMVSYQDLQRQISGIGVISDEVRIQKLNLGEVNPVVMKNLENYLTNYFDKKFNTIKLELDTYARLLGETLKSKQEKQAQLVLNELNKFESELNSMQFKIKKENINMNYYKQVFNLYQKEIDKLTYAVIKLELYLDKKQLVDPKAYNSYRKILMNLNNLKKKVAYSKSDFTAKQLGSNNKVLYNPGTNSDNTQLKVSKHKSIKNNNNPSFLPSFIK